MDIDRDHRITVSWRSSNPPSLPWDKKSSLISMGVYLFRTSSLIKALIQDAKTPDSSHDFGKDVIPRLIRKARVYAYLYDGYWEDIGTIDAYWNANMAFLSALRPVLDERLADPDGCTIRSLSYPTCRYQEFHHRTGLPDPRRDDPELHHLAGRGDRPERPDQRGDHPRGGPDRTGGETAPGDRRQVRPDPRAV
jgi:hypothetical protein